MKNKNFNIETIKQYEAIFGHEKMINLFNEYQEKAEQDLNRVDSLIAQNSRDGLRLIFHSLRSSSLVFGMQGFSFACEDIEEKILNGEELKTIAKFIELSKKIYEQELSSVTKILK